MNNETFWKTKLWTWLHDPAEKALILLRGVNHETGTVRELRKKIFGEASDSRELDRLAIKADRWASAADRPDLPVRFRGAVSFTTDAQIGHPLSGESVRIGDISGDISVSEAEAASFNHFERLLKCDDYHKDFLRLWRFGPELPYEGMKHLWRLLPADTRSPDHTIWDHLRLSSAFAGAMAEDSSETPALLVMSFGPVQEFIAQARSVSDLWAGSHLLSSMAWEGIKTVCQAYGPDSIVFPDLHGVPIVDAWLEEEIGADTWPNEVPRKWKESRSDANPLFTAALPNRFLALVPAGDAEAVAAKVRDAMRAFIRGLTGNMLDELFKVDGAIPEHALKQADRQLRDFPEVHWSVIPWSLAGSDGLADDELRKLLDSLGQRDDYLGESGGMLRKDVLLSDDEGKEIPFYNPNPGVAYPGLYMAAERLHAAAKAVRPFGNEIEKGFRCSLCGEREWLTADKTQLAKNRTERDATPWAQRVPLVVKEGECLCALCALKRFWPRLFTDSLYKRGITGGGLSRYVVSTHALALAPTIYRQAKGETMVSDTGNKAEARMKLQSGDDRDRTALPRKLHFALEGAEDEEMLRRLPSMLDLLNDASEEERAEYNRCLQNYFGEKPEAYYGLILMDGDHMGRWLAGEEGRRSLNDRFHGKTREALCSKGGDIKKYLKTVMPPFPAWHSAISSALNTFSLQIARKVVEDFFLGKLIYAGGDDLLAMVSVSDLPAAMLALRCAYSGVLPEGVDEKDFWAGLSDTARGLRFRRGFAIDKRGKDAHLFRLMGAGATASMGAVAAHHKAPLGAVVRQLRAAEHAAKNKGGRDAFCLTVAKRAGGSLSLIGKWGLDSAFNESDMGLMLELRNVLADPKVSRRAAYTISEVLRDLPAEMDALSSVLSFQMKRQRQGAVDCSSLAYRLSRAAVERHAEFRLNELAWAEWRGPNLWLRNLFVCAEFLAREGRGGFGAGMVRNVNAENREVPNAG